MSVWIDRRNIRSGAGWSTAIVRGVKACRVFVVLEQSEDTWLPRVITAIAELG